MRRTLVKVRIGCHNLRVETGRYDKILPDERISSLGSFVLNFITVIKSRTKPISCEIVRDIPR